MTPPVEASLVATRLGALDSSPRAVSRRVAELFEAHRVGRPEPGSDPEDPRTGLFFVLSMAARTHARALEPLPPVGASTLAAFDRRAALRPGRDEALGQLYIDGASAIRRAEVARAGLAQGDAILAVGDDDLMCLALRDLGETRPVVALDLDERLLGFLAQHGVETHRADVFAQAVPPALRRRFAVAVVDPFRDLDGGLGFLTFAAACLQREPGARLLWADHPDWSFEQPLVSDALAALGWREVERHDDLHAYPLDAAAIRPDALADALGFDRAWMRALIDVTRAFSHLYVLARE